MIILRQKIFGNRENKAKRKAWEEKQGLETYQKKIANNGTNMAQWNNPVNPDLVKRGEFLKEGSDGAKAELRAIHRNNLKHNDIRNNVPKSLYEKHTTFGGMWGQRVDHVGALVEGGEDAYNKVMKERSGERTQKKIESRGVNKNGIKKKPSLPTKSSLSTVKSSGKAGTSIFGGLITKVGKGLKRIARR